MLIQRTEFREYFERIIDDYKKEAAGAPILILVAPDCDAMCAASILMKLFLQEDLEVKVRPVAGYADVRDEIHISHSQTRTVIMVDCGAPTDLKRILNWEALSPRLKLYVIDSHRPVYHGNINDSNRIFVFEESIPEDFLEKVPNDGDSDIEATESVELALDRDEEDGEADAPYPDAAGSEGGSQQSEQLDDEAGEGSVVEGDAGSGAESSPERTRKRARATSSQGSVGGGSESDNEGAEVQGRQRGKRSKKRLRALADVEVDEADEAERKVDVTRGALDGGHMRIDDYMRSKRISRLRRMRTFYSGYLYTIPASFLAWRLCEELGRERKDVLWLACVGIADRLLTERITADTYHACVAVLEARARTMGGDTPKPMREEGGIAFAGRYAHVAPSLEPRWVLHRSWSVRDALIHSDYVSTRLDTYKLGTEPGAPQVDKMLAQTGVHPDLLKGPFDLFPRAARERLFNKLHDLVRDPQYKLGEEMFFPSFVRIVDREPEMSAGDLASAVTGLLGAIGTTSALVSLADKMAKDSAPDGAEGEGAGRAGAGAGGPRGSSPSPATDAQGWAGSWRYNFYLGLDALGTKNIEHFEAGVKCYKALQMAIQRLAPRLVRTGRVHTLKLVRWVELDEDVGETDRSMFTQPVALAALGRYVIRLCRDSLLKWRRKKGRVDPKPVVITVRHPESGAKASAQAPGLGRQAQGWVTVLGLPVPLHEGEAPTSDFLTLFHESAARSGVRRFVLDGFDSAAMALDARDLEAFMRQLDADGTDGGYGGVEGSALASAMAQAEAQLAGIA